MLLLQGQALVQGARVRRHGVAVLGQGPWYRAARTTEHTLET